MPGLNLWQFISLRNIICDRELAMLITADAWIQLMAVYLSKKFNL
jgi:hypothetical protein